MILLESGDHCDPNLNIRHTYLNIKINNQGKTLHVWSLTTESNKGSHQYTALKIQTLSFSSKNDTFRIWRSLCLLNLNIRHTYLNIKISNQGKTLHVWSLTTESNKGSHQWSNLSFSSKNDTFDQTCRVHQYTENSNFYFSSKNDTFRIWRSLWAF